jgi:hypothetical protein
MRRIGGWSDKPATPFHEACSHLFLYKRRKFFLIHKDPLLTWLINLVPAKVNSTICVSKKLCERRPNFWINEEPCKEKPRLLSALFD